MADNVTVDNGALTDFIASTDEAASGHVQRVKLTYSADGSDTHIGADASGLLVNLGSNNDVTVTSGTVTVGGTATVTTAGTASVLVTGGTVVANSTLQAGTNLAGYVGISADGTAVADLLSLTSGTAVAVGIYDGVGDQVAFSGLSEFSASPTLGTAACAQYDALHATPITLSAVVSANAGTGHLMGGVLTSDHDTFSGQILASFFRTTPGAQTAQDAVSVSDAAAASFVGRMVFDFSESNLGGARSVNAQRADLPIPFKCDASADDLFVLLQLWSADTPTFAADDFHLRVLIQPD